MWRTFSARIQTMGWIHLVYTSKMIMFIIENNSFLSNLTMVNLLKKIHSTLAGGHYDL